MTRILCCQMEGGERGRERSESEASRIASPGDDFRDGPGSARPNLPVLAALPAFGRVAFPRPTQSRMQAKGSSSPLSAGKTTPNPTAAPGSPAPAGLTHPAEPPLSLPKPWRVGDPACPSCCPAPAVPTLRHRGGGTGAAPAPPTARELQDEAAAPRSVETPGCQAAPWLSPRLWVQTWPPPTPRATAAAAGPGVGRSAEAPHAASTARSVLGPRRPWAARRPNPQASLG